MYTNLKECNFLLKEVDFLGHVISGNGLAVYPAKIKAIVNWESPKNVMKIRSFLGLTGNYKRFVKGFLTIVAPMTKLAKKNTPFVGRKSARTVSNSLRRGWLRHRF